ncbi:MAG: SIMPL domain-containing protein [Phycisphaerales bacterium]|nr:SIMPL domain-containing protein [Phycisphaerales bacterium]
MMHGIKRVGMAALLGLLMVGMAQAETGEGGTNAGITVQGVGEAKGKPTQVEIACIVSGDAELASDATVKFRDAKKRATAAIEGLKNPDLKVISDGVSVGGMMDPNTQMMIMRGMGGTQVAKPRVQIMEKSRVVLSNAGKLEPDALLETILKILDVAKEGGFQVGPQQPTDYNEMQNYRSSGMAMVSFKLADGTELRDQAYKAALADARGKAEKLAELAGVKLGKIMAIQEMPGSQRPDGSVAGNTAGELSKRVNLTVQFEIVK